MRNVLIFHGTGGYPEENWFPYLKEELEKLDCKVFIPQFPNPREGHTIEDWFNVLKDYQGYINEETILIGHSLGGLFLLRVLEKLKQPIAGAFFVATSVGVKPIKYFESDEKFCGFKFEWEKIRCAAKYFKVYHSDNDSYISLGNGEKLAKELSVDLTFIPNAGHLNAESGYIKFPQLLADIKQIF